MGPEYTHNHCTPMQPVPNVGALRYLKDPVATISELYNRYPDGGEYGWFALCTDTNQFAVWNTETNEWKNSGLVPIEACEESTLTPSANDYLLLYSVALQKAVKVKVSKIATGSSAVKIEAYEESTQTPSANDYLLLYSVALQKAVKVKVSKIATGSSAVNVLKSETHMIDTGDFFPPATTIFPFLKTPGSYGVTFTDQPIAGLDERNFNLKVDYVSHDGSGDDGDQDILQTLTTKDGVSYTRRLYHVGQQVDMSATDFKTAGSAGSSSGRSIISATPPKKPSNGDNWTSTITYIDYTYVSGAWIEL